MSYIYEDADHFGYAQHLRHEHGMEQGDQRLRGSRNDLQTLHRQITEAEQDPDGVSLDGMVYTVQEHGPNGGIA